MKINNINNINFIQEVPKKHINNHSNQNISQQAQKSVVNPNYYQAVNKISFKSAKTPLQYSIQDGEHGKELQTNSQFGPLTLDDYILDYFILNPNGSVNEESLKDFINIYEGFYEEMSAEEDEEISFYQRTIDESTNGVIQFPIPRELLRQTLIEDLSSHVDEKTFAKNALAYFSGEDRKEVAQKFLNVALLHKSQIKEKAIQRTVSIFELSQTKDGSIDLSDLDKKKQILNMIESYEYNSNEEDSATELQKYAKKSDGTLDIDVALGTMNILKYSESGVHPIREVAPVVKHFYDKDPDNKPEILSTLKFLEKSYFSFSSTDSYLQDLMELCFDENGKFNVQKKDIILNLIEETDNWICDGLENSDSYQTFLKHAFNLIIDYIDEQGENILSPTQDIAVNFRKYIEHRMKNLTII